MSEADKFDDNKPRLELLPPTYWEAQNSNMSRVLADWYFYKVCSPSFTIVGYSPLDVLEWAAKTKYGSHNWFKGMRWGRLVGSFHRHCNESDEQTGLWVPRDLSELDEESKMPHGAHAACCLLFLNEYVRGDIGTNDCVWNEEE